MVDVIIIGKGPAGISAALYTVRAGLRTLVIGLDNSALHKTDRVENYYGFAEPVSGKYLLEQGEQQARRLGVKFVHSEVIALEKAEYFEVYTADENYSAKAVLMATGQQTKKVNINGLEEFEGRGVSYCTTCDGFFYRGLKVGLVGFKDYAMHEAMELEPLTKNITIYTNGNELELTEKYKFHASRFSINNKKIKSVAGNEVIEGITFEDGSVEKLDGLFVAFESASSVDFARKLGVITKNNSIVVNENQGTNLNGLFAAGDCTGGFKQIATAVGQGAMAGRKIIEYIRNNS
ncbi:FAD-dependent pyridine nucleotide-disulfide oxidoreductase [Ruminiclostridium papyrosolvens DSM 2782]|uniref:FAD-dependent pyridine nucleotide-disulfide oxidoreductase n=1 Tax=Ruminiclostridium papyrosolvens DSM 2782 TaxID=588581 RepID=F1TE00_9FIRM|nr:NAD(P)/FAD-dependent oxidoreductase [Ruminiclostridium papyrosolvens]EGD47446.1 FAD-dependent pyridine nucleotide-disulfide oxidoreductase [Ruminiclostridium papyrosolvens DSM 2782]WES34791.1 NAD(P)/FAD-dependent oxidoreductase [Ruminiclostridium papyrosolvens DSM 2782]